MILQKRVWAESKIEILFNTIVTSVKAEKNEVSGVKIQAVNSGEERDLATDGVFIFIGFIPNNELVSSGTQKNEDGFVVTSNRCETRHSGIFVVGDLRDKYYRQILTAAADGGTAALTAAHYVEEMKATNPALQPK